MEGPGFHQPYPNPLALPLLPPPLPPIPIPPNQAMEDASARKKVIIRWLKDDVQRRSTFKKRRKGIMKKAEELHILCGVETCAIVYGAGQREPEVWPGIEAAASMCRRFKQMPELGRARMMRTHTHFLQELVGKKAQQLWHQHDDIADVQARCELYDGLMGADLRGVSRECLVRVHAMIRGLLRDLYESCTVLRAGSSAALPTVAPQDNPRDAVPATRVSTGDAQMEALLPAPEENDLWGDGVHSPQD